ncbi:iron-containing alcohol dehydrogenase [Caballeronia temeraria]|uniref:Iron-containing alcohol dehydrogenase n=1 Tax=Caballeronia temeraria TaxID=1777137 RepID=A0A158DL97_9BURK|nr:maleylacetate reductase [Caballeronia temeraria]SAK95354.1 iron-containing alcohol dehydrogenase [Caballeronia temeraria]
MPDRFVYQGACARVVFGAGSLDALAAELGRLGCSRALVLSTRGQQAEAEALASELGLLCAGVFADATMHTPLAVTQRALAYAHELHADCTVAFGGGSTIGLGKALAIRTGMKQIAIPTTYAGSEVTPILGETVEGNKTTQRDPAIQPQVVIYDVDLTLSLPVSLSATSGLNAMAHAVEALYARDANPIISLMAEEGIAALSRSLPKIVSEPGDRDARSDALYGAWLAGTCLGSVGMALHHKICHVLGGIFDLPHAEMHAVILAHVVAFNCTAAPQAMTRIARALHASDPALGIDALARRLGAPRSLAELGMPEAGIDIAAEHVTHTPYWNPRPVEREAVRSLIADAFHGRVPRHEQNGTSHA